MDKIQDKKIETFIIESKDFYGDNCLDDSLSQKKEKLRGPQGEVYIYECDENNDKKKLIQKSNLVVFLGRELLAQRLVNIENPFFTSGNPSKDEFLCWFGLGEGGVRPADPLSPIPPINNDNCLYSPIPMFDSTSSIYADFHTAGDSYKGGGVYPATGSYVKQFDLNGVVFQSDVLNDGHQLVVQITTTISTTNANGYQLSEAGLFTAKSDAAGYNGNFSLFSRITFPALIKTGDRRLIFVWYLYL